MVYAKAKDHGLRTRGWPSPCPCVFLCFFVCACVYMYVRVCVYVCMHVYMCIMIVYGNSFAALQIVASITSNVKKLCASSAVRGTVSESDRKKLTTCADEAKKKLTEEITAIEKEREDIETKIKEVLVKNNIC